MATKKDKTMLPRKVTLRLSLRKHLQQAPIVLETRGGAGEIRRRVYADVVRGAVLDSDIGNCEGLARARPGWAVYETKHPDVAIAEGLAGELPVNLLDVDAVGEPWPVLEAFFSSERVRVNELAIAVTDGLRQKIRLTGGWQVHSMRRAVEIWGNQGVNDNYLDVCRWKLEQLAARQRYQLNGWTGYHCGANDDFTHYAAVLTRPGGS